MKSCTRPFVVRLSCGPSRRLTLASPALAQPVQGEGRADTKVHGVARLLGDPRSDRVNQLAVKEDHFEEHHRAFDDEHLDDRGRLLRLDGVGYDLNAGEASRHQEEQEHPEQGRHHTRVRIEPGEAAENFNESGLEREREDGRLDRAPYYEDEKCHPGYTGLEVAARRSIEKRERRASEAQQHVLEHQQAKAHRADHPANECDSDAQHSGPEQPDAAAGIPPRHEHNGDESAASRAERNRVHGEGCAPHTRRDYEDGDE